MFKWTYIGAAHAGPKVSLQTEWVECARLSQNVATGEWWITLRMHLPYEQRINRRCTSFDAGQAGAMIWAQRHQAKIQAVADAKMIAFRNRNRGLD